jgi:Pre-SET motif
VNVPQTFLPHHLRSRTGPEQPGEFSTLVQDRANWILDDRRKSDGRRRLYTSSIFYERWINEQIIREEPDAPEVNLIMPRSRLTRRSAMAPEAPPWEFVYTNRLLYRHVGFGSSGRQRFSIFRVIENNLWQGVGNPVQSPGCTCTGPCSSTDEGCACAQRQKANSESKELGFAYDQEGRLIVGPEDGICASNSDFPTCVGVDELWVKLGECNAQCGCPPEVSTIALFVDPWDF